MSEMLKGGTSVVFVSHAIKQVEQLCTKVLWLEDHTTKMIGDSAEVCRLYNSQS
jgi:ABC-type polysaccharide/polyol phosphate transport system ATPase subunit